MALPKVLANFTTSLASKITSSAASMTLSISTDPDGTTLAGQYIVTVDEGTSVEEHMLVTLAGATATIDTRGLSKVDMSTSVSGNKFPHDRGAEVKITNAVLVRVINELNGVTSTSAMVGTTGTAWRIGNGTDQDAFVYAQNADANKPFVKYDKTLNKWLISNDGTTTYDIAAGGSGLTAGSGIAVAASAISTKLNASGLLSASLGSGSDELGLITDISAALAGTSGTPSAGNKFVTASDVSVTATTSAIVRSGTDGTITNWLNSNFVLGESINGSSTPKSVFISDGTGGLTAGRLYLSSSTNVAQHAAAFNGFVKASDVVGATVPLFADGIVSGFSGLSPGLKYYVSGTQGAVTATPSATAVVSVGYAASATQLLIVPETRTIIGFGSRSGGSSGTQSITGIGGRPKVIKITAQNGYTTGGGAYWTGWSQGIATNVSNERCIYWYSSDTNRAGADNSEVSSIDTSNIIHCSYNDSGAGGDMYASLQSIDSDGFTLNWGTASGGGTVNFIYEVEF